jgi:hypothetical protein
MATSSRKCGAKQAGKELMRTGDYWRLPNFQARSQEIVIVLLALALGGRRKGG